MSNLKIYKASAGSGKTYTLAVEYIKELLLSRTDQKYRHILAVTFTKDATGEMKDRILAELYGLAFDTQDSQGFLNSLRDKLREAGRNSTEKEIRTRCKQILDCILHDYSRLNITTIDSFFQRVLRNLARELGRGSKFNLEMDVNKVLAEAVRATIEKANENQQILNWLTTYIENKLEEGKNWRIEEEIFDFSKCIYNEFFQEHEAVLRKQLDENPEIFVQLNKQQKEIQHDCKTVFTQTGEQINKIFNDYQLEINDFGNSKYGILLIHKIAGGDYNPTIGANVEKCRDDSSFWGGAKSSKKREIISLADRFFIPLLNKTLEILAVYSTSKMIVQNLHQLGLVWDITSELSEQNAENNRFMLSDTALFLNRMMDHSDAPFIYEKLGAEIHHVMIDEFQDTSRLQWNNFKVLLSEILAKDNFSLIVGDVKQSIYRWRNGDWRILNSIGNELQAKVINLEYNYRSEKEIVEFNNRFFAHAANCLNLLHELKLGDVSQSPFLSTYAPENIIQKSPKETDKGFVSIDFLPNKDEEGTGYADLMKTAVLQKLIELSEAGIPANKICFLTRTNKEIMILGEYLASLRVQYPVLSEKQYLNLISNEAFQLGSSLAIKIIIDALKCIAEPDNPVYKAQLEFHLSLSSLPFSGKEQELRSMPLFELIEYLYRLFDLKQFSGQTAYLFAFFDAVLSYLNHNSPDIHTFLSYWDDELHKKTLSSGPAIDGIQAMTIHKSKGLQFHTVIIPYCDWKIDPRSGEPVWCESKADLYDLELLPISYSRAMNKTVFSPEYQKETAQTWLDNLNILYVAFTRAEHNLIILTKYRENLDEIEKINTVSDLLQFNIIELESEENSFVKGRLDNSVAEKDKSSDNLLKQTPRAWEASFVSEELKPGKSIFKQSNKSREFIHPESPSKETYVAYGNVMHKLFEHINTLEDVDNAIENHVSDGLIHPSDKQLYKQKVLSAIKESKVEDWFSGNYTNYKESTILMEEDGELKQKRPDRVLFSGDSTLVVDFKFGEPHNAHKKQVKQYMDLLGTMNHPNVKGYLWYVEDRKIETIS